jgi:hypothetical protein
MPFSSGTYSLPGPALAPGDTVSSVENNQFRNDVATAFNETFLRDGTAEATANLPMDGFKLTGLAAGTTAGDSARYDELAALDAAAVKLTDNQTIAGTKTFSSPIAADITGNAATVTNGVYTTGNQTIGGTKTFSSPIVGDVTGNAGTATTASTANAIADGAVSTSAKIANAVVTAAKLDGAQTGTAPIYGARAWVNFNGTGTVAIRASGNVSSITDNGVGDYTVNFATAMVDANYAFMASCGNTTGAGTNPSVTTRTQLSTTTSARVILNGATGTANDLDTISVSIFR